MSGTLLPAAWSRSLSPMSWPSSWCGSSDGIWRLSDGTQGNSETRMGVDGGSVVFRIFDFPADPVDVPDQLQERARCVRHAAQIPVVSLDYGELCDGAGAQRLSASRAQFNYRCGGLDADRDDHRGSGGLVDGVCADQADQGCPALDALDQDDAIC